MKPEFFNKSSKIVVGLALLLWLAFSAAVGIAQDQRPLCKALFSWTWNEDFGTAFWDVGSHSIVTKTIIPDSESVIFPAVNFEVVETAQLFTDNVLITFLSLQSSEEPITEIHPDQQTIYYTGLVSAYGLQYQEVVESFLGWELWISVDGGEFIELPHGPIVSLCAMRNPSHYLRAWDWIQQDK